MKSIGIQGGKGSFSEEAANQFILNHGIDDFKIVYPVSYTHLTLPTNREV